MKIIFPFVERLPCLTPCQARPTLAHLLEPLRKLPVSEFIFVVSYHKDEIRSYMDANYPEMRVSFIEQRENKGLGHTVSLASNSVSRSPLLIVDTNTVLDIDWASFSQSEYSTIAVQRVIDERPYGLVELREGFVGCLIQKPQRIDLMLAGCYFIRESKMLFQCLFDLIHAGRRRHGKYQLTDALQQMIESGVEMQIQEIDLPNRGKNRNQLDNFFGTDPQPLSRVLA